MIAPELAPLWLRVLSLPNLTEGERETLRKKVLTVTLNGRLTRTLGRCRYHGGGFRRIELSARLPEDERWQTLLHEAAHALCDPGDGHGPRFQAVARRLGTNPKPSRKSKAKPARPVTVRCLSTGRLREVESRIAAGTLRAMESLRTSGRLTQRSLRGDRTSRGFSPYCPADWKRSDREDATRRLTNLRYRIAPFVR